MVSMLAISRILVPVDFSERALRMLPYAKAMALRYGAQLTLMHVVSPIMLPATALSGPAWTPSSRSSFLDRSNQMQEWAKEQLEGVEVQRLTYEGDPVEQLLSFAQAADVQLAVMSTHGYGALRRFLIGSVAAKLLHDLPCPVLTGVHVDESRVSAAAISKVLCAVDLGPHTPEVLGYAAQLARDFDASLEAVYVESESSVMEQARARLHDAVEAAHATAEKLYVEGGEIRKAVCSVARAAGASVLVIGRGSHDEGAGRLRTNAYAIIRESPCPVFSV
jgi:nucleotide-binding universal stress UspA family protein